MDLFTWLKRKLLAFKTWILMILCCLPGQSSSTDAQTRDIEKELHKEKKRLRQQIRILLLGSGESGKSTFIKQMVIINGAGQFTADEVRAYRQQIYQNVISAMRVLVDARQKLGYEWVDTSLEKKLPSLLRITVADLLKGIDQPTFAEIAPLVADLWNDPAIKQTFEQRNLFQITDSCSYFFNDIDRVSSNDFTPTNKVILEDRRTNRVVESRSVFETIVNNVAFKNVSVILFMNKSDLLIEKVPKSDIRNYFSDFTGDHRNVRDVQYFLVDKFEKSRKERHRPFFYHFTTAVDTENMRRVFRDVREVILKQNIEQLNMQ